MDGKTGRVKRKHLFHWSCFLHLSSVKSLTSFQPRQGVQAGRDNTKEFSRQKPAMFVSEETVPRTTQEIAITAALIFKTS